MDELFAANEPPVYRFLLRLCSDPDLASDLTQETLTRGWQQRDQLREPGAIRTWLFRIAHNTFYEHLRHEQKQHGTQQLGTQQLSETNAYHHGASPEQLASNEDLGRKVWLAMEELPPRQKQVLHLRVVEQLSTIEIGKVLSINTQAVRSNLAAARKRLRQLLADELPDSSNATTNR